MPYKINNLISLIIIFFFKLVEEKTQLVSNSSIESIQLKRLSIEYEDLKKADDDRIKIISIQSQKIIELER
jgi:hypothetical protein